MSRKSAFGIVAGVLVLASAALFIVAGNDRVSKAETSPSPQAAKAPDASVPAPAQTSAIAEAPVANTPELSDADLQKVLKVRTIGKADAPVKLVEFASLSCPHCADFYKNTFPQVKKDYIDTGKIQYSYIDFPLNAPALSAAAVALCMPEDNYFRFIDYLFQSQEQWAMSDKPDTTLIQDGKLLGADGDKLQQCLNSKKLKSEIVSRMQKEGQAFTVDSTPTFVFDRDVTTKISGEMPYADFKKLIDARLAKKASGAKK